MNFRSINPESLKGMSDVKNSLRSVEWSTHVKKIDRSSVFPMVVRPTTETASTYNITEDPVLLHQFWVTQRLTVQSLEEEGAYVVGPQLEIPAEYTGTFQYRNDQKGNQDVHMYTSVKEISMSMPERVFPQERLVVYPVTSQEIASSPGEKTKSLILQPTDQLTVIEKKEVFTVAPANRFAAFSGKPKFKFVAVPCVSFLLETSKEVINLPLYTKGKFSNLSHKPSHGREYDFKDILREIDLPINLTTCQNCPQTILDEHFLRPGMRLRLTEIEEHEVIIGVTTQESIVEFAADDVEFILPKHLVNDGDKEQEIAYRTALQRFLMECQIKNSPVNTKDYQKSIRTHISRVVRKTQPKPLSQTAANRVFKYSSKSNLPFQNGMPAIALLSSSNSIRNPDRRSSLPPDGYRAHRHSMPLPAPPPLSVEATPPLPPRNSRSGSSLRVNGGLPKRPHSARLLCPSPFEVEDFPTRPPPPPPNFPPERPKSASVNGGSQVSGEQIWEALDENCLRRLRDQKNGVEKERNDSVFESLQTVEQTEQRIITDVTQQMQSVNVVDGIFHGHLSVNTSEVSVRPTSPEFSLPVVTTNATSTTSSDSVGDIASSSADNVATSTDEIVVESIEVNDSNTDQSIPIISSPSMNPNVYENFSIIQQSSSAGAETISAEKQEKSLIVELPKENENNADSPQEQTINAESAIEDSESQRTSLEISIASSTSTENVDKSDEDEIQNGQSSNRSSTSSTSSSSTSKSGFYHVSQFSVVSDDSNPLQQVSFACNYVPSPRNWIPPNDLSGMSVSEVSDALRYIGMNEDTVEWFRAEKVDGHLLCAIEDDVFSQHFRLTPFQQKKMVMFLKGWRPKLK